jgi:hypothetical protein
MVIMLMRKLIEPVDQFEFENVVNTTHFGRRADCNFPV